MNNIATCTILVVACLSWPCFFDSSKICSFSKPQSPESLEIVMIATSSLEVDARSEAYVIKCQQLRQTMVAQEDILPAALASQAQRASPVLLVHCSVRRSVSEMLSVKQKASFTLASSCASGICLSASFV